MVDSIVKDENTSIVSEETVNKVKEAVSEGKTIVTDVVSEVVNKSDISKTTLKKVEQEVKQISNKAKVAQYLNLEVVLKADNTVLGNITKLSKAAEFKVAIPKNLNLKNRKFYVVRSHNGEVDKLDTVLNADGTLSFKTDRFSIYALAYEDLKVPGKVAKVKATIGNTAIKLSWSKVEGATGYRLFIAKNNKWVKAVDIPGNTYTFKKLAQGIRYNFAVRAYNNTGTTVVWADKYEVIKTFTKPSKVSNFSVNKKSKTAVATTWSKSTGATGYIVYMVKNGKWVKVDTVKGNRYTFKGLKKNTKYKFAVKAYKTDGKTIVYADKCATMNVTTK